MNRYKFKTKAVLQFLVFPIILALFFYIIPIGLMIYYSFTNYNGYSNNYEFVGFENYLNVFDSDNLEVFKVLGFYLLSALLQFVIGMLLAFFVFFQKKWKTFYTIIIVLPLFINSVAVGAMFILFFKGGGTFDTILNIFSIPTFKWIGDERFVNYTLAFITMWRYTPFTFLLIYTAIRSVDSNLIKSAILQGASNYQIAKYVLLPNIKLTIRITCLMLVVGAISALEIPTIITSGAIETKTILMRIKEVAFGMRNFGMASVLTMVVIVIIVIATIVIEKVGVKDEKQDFI